MGFHYGYEKRKFDAEWTRLEQEYRAAGMDDRQIAAMKEYDWTWFCSQRTYQNRVQALPSEQCEDESEQSCLFRKFESLSCTWDTGDVDSRRFGWLSSLEDAALQIARGRSGTADPAHCGRIPAGRCRKAVELFPECNHTANK